jgi:hypothetical protein
MAWPGMYDAYAPTQPVDSIFDVGDFVVVTRGKNIDRGAWILATDQNKKSAILVCLEHPSRRREQEREVGLFCDQGRTLI